MNSLNAYILFTSVIFGETIKGVGRTFGAKLKQSYKPLSNQFSPDFEALPTDKKSVAYPFLTGQKTGKIFVPNTIKFAYNGVDLTFGTDNKCTTDGFVDYFEKVTQAVVVSGKTYNIPGVRVLKNLVPISGYDNDLITISGTVESQGRSEPFENIHVPVIIAESEGSQYTLSIVNDYGSQITTENSSLPEKAEVYKDGVEVTEYTGLVFKWIKMLATSNVVMAPTTRNCTVTDDDVDNKLKLKCEAYKDGELLASDFDEITDFSDPEDILLPVTGISGTQFTDATETATVTPKVVNRVTQDTVTGFTFSYYTHDNQGDDFIIASQTAARWTGGTSVSITGQDLIRANRGLGLAVQANKSA